jgi:hypothetical protein
MVSALLNGATRHRGPEFPNFWSRLLLKRVFEKQHGIPSTPPWLLRTVLNTIERMLPLGSVDQIPLDRPIFLIGLPRTGTTMVQDLICAHPGVAYFTNAMHQFRSAVRAVELFRKWLRLDVRGERFLEDSVEVSAASPNEGTAFWGTWFGWSMASLEYRPKAAKDFTAEQVWSMYETLRKVISTFGNPVRRFFNKSPGLVPEILLLNELFPDAKFIHLVRDPRPCANSLLKLKLKANQQLNKIRAQGGHGIFDDVPIIPYPRLPRLAEYISRYSADDVRTTAHLWNDAIDFVHERKEKLNSFYEVRYEDILKDPRGEASRILEFCDLPRSGESSQFFRDKIDKVGAIHHTNRYDDYDVITSICEENMRKLGYL